MRLPAPFAVSALRLVFGLQVLRSAGGPALVGMRGPEGLSVRRDGASTGWPFVCCIVWQHVPKDQKFPPLEQYGSTIRKWAT